MKTIRRFVRDSMVQRRSRFLRDDEGSDVPSGSAGQNGGLHRSMLHSAGHAVAHVAAHIAEGLEHGAETVAEVADSTGFQARMAAYEKRLVALEDEFRSLSAHRSRRTTQSRDAAPRRDLNEIHRRFWARLAGKE